jgi:hypothetical protein
MEAVKLDCTMSHNSETDVEGGYQPSDPSDQLNPVWKVKTNGTGLPRHSTFESGLSPQTFQSSQIVTMSPCMSREQ